MRKIINGLFAFLLFSGNVWADQAPLAVSPLKTSGSQTTTCEVGCPCARGKNFLHLGVDIVGLAGDAVYAPVDGKVILADFHNGYAGTVVIEDSKNHNHYVIGHLLCDEWPSAQNNVCLSDPGSDKEHCGCHRTRDDDLHCGARPEVECCRKPNVPCPALLVKAPQDVVKGVTQLGVLGPNSIAQNGGFGPHVHLGVRTAATISRATPANAWKYAGYWPASSATQILTDWQNPLDCLEDNFNRTYQCTGGRNFLTCGANTCGHSVPAVWNGGNQTCSSPAPPQPVVTSVKMTAPVNGSTLSNTATLKAEVSGEVKRVQFLQNGLPIGNQTAVPPYQMTYNTVGTANGSYVFSANGYNSSGRLVAFSGPMTLAINNQIADRTSPTVGTVLITPAPVRGKVSGVVQLSVYAYDANGIASVDFLRAGQVIATVTSQPYQFYWNTNQYPNGTATLQARARDSAGNVRLSAITSVIVDNAPMTPSIPARVLSPCNPAYSSCPTKLYQLVGQDTAYWGYPNNPGLFRALRDSRLSAIKVMIPLSWITDTAGRFNRTRVDQFLSLVQYYGKKLVLSIVPIAPNYRSMGNYPTSSTPDWWISMGVPYTMYTLPEESIYPTIVPALWDPRFLYRYVDIIKALGTAFNGHLALEQVQVGIGNWGETFFDLRFHRAVDQTPVVQEWKNLGFTEDVWVEYCRTVFETYRRAFSRTPLSLQLTDLGYRLLDETDDQHNFVRLRTLTERIAETASANNLDLLQYDGLFDIVQYGTDEVMYDVLEANRHRFTIGFELQASSGRDTVTGCASDFRADRCTNEHTLRCALARAQRAGATHLTLWASDWMAAQTTNQSSQFSADLTQVYQGQALICPCPEVARVSQNQADTLELAKEYCRSPQAIIRGDLPNMYWSPNDGGGLTVTDANGDGFYEFKLPCGLIPYRPYRFSYEGCQTPVIPGDGLRWSDWGLRDDCTNNLGPFVTPGQNENEGLALSFYTDPTGTIHPCGANGCPTNLPSPPPVARRDGEFLAVNKAYLCGHPDCAELRGNLPGIFWDRSLDQYYGLPSDEWYKFHMPPYADPFGGVTTGRLTYVECNSMPNNWALYGQLCSEGLGGPYCHLNDDGNSYSLSVQIAPDGTVSPY